MTLLSTNLFSWFLPGTSQSDECESIFRKMGDQAGLLESVSSSAEKVFLEVANLLEKISTDVQRTSSKSEELVKLESGQKDEENAITFATNLVRETIEVVVRTNAVTADSVLRLGKIQALVNTLLKNEEKLKSAIAPFTIVRMMFKIHSAPLSDEHRTIFYGLSDELERLDLKVREVFFNQFENLRKARTTIRELTPVIRTQITKAQEDISTRQKTMDETFVQLERKIAENKGRTFRLNQCSTRLQQEIGKMIMAMQFHDITHQRLQHVCQAISEMQGEFQVYQKKRTSEARRHFGGYLNGAIEIQRNQLDSLLEGISEAEDKIRSGTKSLLNTSEEVSKEAMQLQDISDNNSSVEGVVQSLLELLEFLPKQLTQAHEIASQAHLMIKPLQGMVSNLTGILTSISMDIRLIALNSQVQAAHIQIGTGLDNLSAQTCSLSDQILEVNQSLATDLQTLVEEFSLVLESLHFTVEDSEATLVATLQSSKKAELDLHNLRDMSFALMMRISEIHTGVEQGSQELMSQLKFGEKLAQTCEPIYKLMDRLIPMAKEMSAGQVESANSRQSLDRLKKNYTMQDEHQIHQKALKSGKDLSLQASVSAPAKKPAVDIDFFDAPAPQAPERTSRREVPTKEIPATAKEVAVDIDFFDEPTPIPPAPSTIEPKKNESAEKQDLGSNVELF